MKAFRLISLLAYMALFLSSCATPLDKKDLEAFLNQREICDHLRGEIPDPSDPERLKEVVDSAPVPPPDRPPAPLSSRGWAGRLGGVLVAVGMSIPEQTRC